MQPVLTRDEMRAADAAALATVSHDTLVARAGTAVGLAALRMLGGAYGRRVTVVAGKGSNGADGRVAAALLARRGARVTVLDAADAPAALAPCDLVIDAAYGTGFRGSYTAPAVPAGTAVLAVDLPSGLDADSGEAPGSPLRAARTVTFAAAKPGLLQGCGPRLAGAVVVADIGIVLGPAAAALVEDADVAAWLLARPRVSHKWRSAVGVGAGSAGMEGAAVLCTRGAMAGGAGMIRLGAPGDPVAAWPTEAVRMSLPAEGWSGAFVEAIERCRAVVLGPGLGRSEAMGEDIRAAVVAVPMPLVIDADALFALGAADEAAALLARRSAPTVLTPHDGEYARLAGGPPGEDRLAAARALSVRLGAIVLLKGPLTAVASPSSAAGAASGSASGSGSGSGGEPDVLLAAAGTPALATAGTGDVLSGLIAAFVARGLPPARAAALAAHVHGRAAGTAAPEGLVAGDLPPLVAGWLGEELGHGRDQTAEHRDA
jgi:NAD(P)H-hydrate epimerase